MERGVEVDRSRFFSSVAKQDSLLLTFGTAAVSAIIRVAHKSVLIENPAWADFMATVATAGGLTLVTEGIIVPAIRQTERRLRKSVKRTP